MLLAWAVIIITLKFLQNHLLKIENTRDDYILLIIVAIMVVFHFLEYYIMEFSIRDFINDRRINKYKLQNWKKS